MRIRSVYLSIVFVLTLNLVEAQELAYTKVARSSFERAHTLAYEGDHNSAKSILLDILKENPGHTEARILLAQTYSWDGQYNAARREFNQVTSGMRSSVAAWVGAIKNELYAKNEQIALGLANKAIHHLGSHQELNRLRQISEKRLISKEYPHKGWHNVPTKVVGTITGSSTHLKTTKENREEKKEEAIAEVTNDAENSSEKKALNNRVDVRNAVTVFDQRYDPMIYTSISYKRQTLAGALIPRINYSNRLGKNGLQYDLDFYPKFSKRFYAYLNYGYSNSLIYPKHKFGGDLYANLPGAFEFSAGGRHITFASGDVSVITNSLGHYRGNYYFSLRSYITPKPDNLTRFSGNLLVRKYTKDADNYFGFTVGMGYSPELRQIISGDELLAETLLYVESQRINFEYQFTGRNNQNAYRANIGATRQELAFAAGKFFYGISAGITYQVKF